MMRQRTMVTVCVCLIGGLSSGCLKLNEPPSARVESKVPVLETWAKLTAENGGAVGDNWVATFNDPVLDALVAEALDNNRDIQAAAARWERSVAVAKQVGAALWPQVDFQTGGLAGAGIANGTTFFEGVANWELDLWGRIRYLTSSARADAYAARADLEFARQSIAAQVAETYYLAVANRLRLVNSQGQLTIQTEIDRIQQVKLKEGQSGRLESELSKADMGRFRADLASRQAAYEEALRALEVLLGRFPAAEVRGAAALPEIAGAVPAGLPAQLLERRPDIIASEAAVASAFFGTESARADLLPRISLTALGGFASPELNGLLSRNNAGLSAGGSLFQPIFDAGARFATIEQQKALQKQTLAQYAATALNAFREVQNGLANELYFRESWLYWRASQISMDVALPIAQTRYRAGEITLLNFKQVQTQAYDTTDAAIATHFAQVQQRIQMFRALGGSIQGAPSAIPATQPSLAPATQPLTTQPAQ